MPLYLAPLQGFTDLAFRNAWHKHFTGVDADYAPYITLQNDGSIRNAQWRDIDTEQNTVLPIPQILAQSAEEALALVARIAELDVYKEININMGCPFPMVTNRGRGSALLQKPEVIAEILDALFAHYGETFAFSVKMRCGLESADEMTQVIEVLNKYPLSHVILHPRIAKQLYKGEVSRPCFAQAQELLKHTLIYNGDICTLDDYQDLMQAFPNLDGLMLGRGLLRNPLLAQEITTGEVLPLRDKLELFEAFHDALFYENSQTLSGDGHLLSKMKSYIPYFAHFNMANRKAYKLLKKSQSIKAYQERMRMLLAL